MTLEPSTEVGTPLREWVKGHQPADVLLWAGGVRAQAELTWELQRLLWRGYDESQARPPRVVSTHRSKSVTLPVLELANDDVRLRLRGNFFNWQVSVESTQAVRDVFDNLFGDRGNVALPVYCEGFRDKWVFPSYAESPSKFTVTLPYLDHALWAFVWLLTRQFAVREEA